MAPPLERGIILSEEQELIPIEQQTLTFYSKPIVVVRLPDGRPGVVLCFICENLQLDSKAQVRRIRRTNAIADDLVYTHIQTDGGPQTAPTLVLHAVPFWLAGIDPKRVREEIRPDIIRYQKEVVDVLYAWAKHSTNFLNHRSRTSRANNATSAAYARCSPCRVARISFTYGGLHGVANGRGPVARKRREPLRGCGGNDWTHTRNPRTVRTSNAYTCTSETSTSIGPPA